MAERRMFTKKIIDSDAFLDMPLTTQALYFHLNMRADDDGFVNNPKKIGRMIGATDDDLKLLLAKRFVLGFESGVIVIKHWRMHNLIRSDRYHKTEYEDEFSHLEVKENGSYTELATTCLPNGNQVSPEDRLGKDRLGKDRLGNSNNKRFTPPTIQDVKAYCIQRGNEVDPERFIDFYESKGWMVGKNKMKDWKAAVRNWERKEKADKLHKARFGYIDEWEKK